MELRNTLTISLGREKSPVGSISVHKLQKLPLIKISGYTPTEPASIIPFTEAEEDDRRNIDNYQKGNLLKGFTARQLVELGVYPDPNTQSISLTNPIQ